MSPLERLQWLDLHTQKTSPQDSLHWYQNPWYICPSIPSCEHHRWQYASCHWETGSKEWSCCLGWTFHENHFSQLSSGYNCFTPSIKKHEGIIFVLLAWCNRCFWEVRICSGHQMGSQLLSLSFSITQYFSACFVSVFIDSLITGSICCKLSSYWKTFWYASAHSWLSEQSMASL